MVCVCVILLSRAAVHADGTPIKITNARVGFDGSFKVGRQAPVEFEITGPEGKTVVPVLRAADPDGRPTQQPLPAVTLSSSPKKVQGLVRSGRLDGSIQIQIFDETADLNQAPLHQTTLRAGVSGAPLTSLRLTSQLWLTIGKQPMLQKGLERWNHGRAGLVRLVELPDGETTFSSGEALDSVDALVVNGDVILNENTSHAIRDWVKQGGRLVVAVGDASSSLKESPLAEWLPALPTGRLDLTKLSGFNDLVPRSSTLRTLTTLPAARFERNSGTTIASGLAEPLAIRAAYGRGYVTMVAIRLDVPPLLNWEPESQGALAAVLAGLPNPVDISAAATARSEAASELNPAAVTDLQIQLNHSLDHFAAVNRPSHWQVMGWIALFALVIGPLDYYLVTYVLKRPEWTWGTLVAWSLLAAFLATSLGDRLNQKEAVSRQIDMLDLDPATRSVAVRSWFGFYSNQSQRVQVASEPNAALIDSALIGSSSAIPPSQISWVTRPSEGFRGMYRSGGMNDAQPMYRFSTNRAEIENLPLEVWSSGSVESGWKVTSNEDLPVQADLHVTGINRLAGTIQLNLPVDVTDWFLAYGNFAYFDRTGPGGEPMPLSSGTTWNLANAGSNLLRGRLVTLIEKGTISGEGVEPDSELSRRAYDSQQVDPFRIGMTVSFYKLLGGEGYTKLQNQSLNRFDVSELLDLNRAVLFGRIKESPTTITVDGKKLPIENQTSLIRIMIPVKPAERSSDAPPTKDILDYRR